MKFEKEFLRELWDGDENVVETKMTGNSRWSIQYRRIFKHEGKLYETRFRRGATECQDECPYQDESDLVECQEVFPVQKTVTVYE